MKKILSAVCAAACILSLAGLASAYDTKAAGSKSATQKAPAGLSGKVVETMDSGGYTYVQLEKAGKKTWVAMPQTKVTKGSTITCKPGMEMKNFESKTLKKKFDSIIFSDGIVQ